MKRILLFTGNGKGKTTAALGAVLRAVGHGQRCLVVQFIKSRQRAAAVGEIAACAHLPGVRVETMGLGFVPRPDSPLFAVHRQAAVEALELARRALQTDACDVLVLDEICGAIARQLLDESRVVELLRLPARCSCIIMTGRDAAPALREQADTVTEMRCLRHARQSGVAAEAGVEY